LKVLQVQVSSYSCPFFISRDTYFFAGKMVAAVKSGRFCTLLVWQTAEAYL
jgi:hypothetical protein